MGRLFSTLHSTAVAERPRAPARPDHARLSPYRIRSSTDRELRPQHGCAAYSKGAELSGPLASRSRFLRAAVRTVDQSPAQTVHSGREAESGCQATRTGCGGKLSM